MTWIAIAFFDDRQIAAVSPVFELESEATRWAEDSDERSGGNLTYRVWCSRELWEGEMFARIGVAPFAETPKGGGA